ncbi:hypothetical protein CDIK_4359, partial [Cucumispora dikerogammari]
GDRLLTEEVIRFVENEIRLECTITLKTIQTRIHNAFNIKPCLETIRRSLLDISITLKRLNCVLEAVNSPRSKELRFEYANYFLNDLTLEDKFLIFIDESPFKISMRRNYGRSPAGTRASMIVPTNRGRNLSLISAINGERVLYSVVIDGGAKAQDFKLFIRGLLPILTSFGLREKCILFYDNASIHYAREIEEFVEENDLRRKFLSPYSYMLNPIEFCFGKVKTIIRNHIRDHEKQSFALSIVDAMNQITHADMTGYFTLIRRNCGRALDKRDFD